MNGSKVLRVGILSALGTLNPQEAKESVSSMILSEVYETPFSRPLQSEPPEPLLLAEPLNRDPGSGGLVYAARLRSDVVFSDGTPLTPDLFVKSLSAAPEFRDVASAEADGQRIVFRLRRPHARFDLILTTAFSSIAIEKDGRYLGTGPFMFETRLWLSDVHSMKSVRLIRNPRYRGSADIEAIEFRVYPQSADGGTELLLEAAKRGEIDFTYGLTSIDATALRGHPYIPAISTGNSTGFLHFNCETPGLDNVVVRKALAFAIDRRRIAESLYERNPLAYAASTILPPMMGRDRYPFTYDLTRAKALAESVRDLIPRNVSLLLMWAPRPYHPNPTRTGELIQEQLAELGMKVTLVAPRDRADFFARTRRGAHELMMGGWIADTPDPADFLDAILPSSAIPSPENDNTITHNTSRFSNVAMDAALRNFRREPTEAHRVDVMRILHDEAPLVPLIYGQAVAVLATRVRGFRPSALGVTSLASLELV